MAVRGSSADHGETKWLMEILCGLASVPLTDDVLALQVLDLTS